jgi:hypothetical protein
MPLHRIECWTGSYFRAADLWEVGNYILVRHHTGDPLCTSLTFQKNLLDGIQNNKDDEEQKTLKEAAMGERLAEMGEHLAAMGSEEPPAATDPSPLSCAAAMVNLATGSDTEDDAGSEASEFQEDYEADLGAAYGYNDVPPSAPSTHLATAQLTGFFSEHPRHDELKNNYVRVVHINGVHHIALVACSCHGSEQTHADLMASNLVPTSFQ